MRTNYVPALVMLTAGFIACVIAIKTGQPLGTFVRQLLLVLILFYILGGVIKLILDRNFGEMDDFENVDLGEEVLQQESEQSDEEADEDSTDEQEETPQE